MAIGDYMSSLFLGNSGSEQTEASKRGTDELWKIYSQAYNIKPVWDGKKWTIPPGAIQRFQMLLPILQAQIAAGKSGQGQQGNDKGMLGGFLKSGGEGIFGAIGKKNGGWGGIMDKVGESIKGLFGPSYSEAPAFDQPTQQAAADWDQAFVPEMTGGDLPSGGLGNDDWGPVGEAYIGEIPVDDYSSYFNEGDWSGMY